MTSWTPANIGPICQEQHAPLTQCSATGYMFLALVTQLYGKPKTSHTTHDSREFGSFDFGGASDYSGFSNSPFSSPVSQTPLGPIPIKSTAAPVQPQLGPVLHDDLLPGFDSEVHSHGPRGSQGYSRTSYIPALDFDKEFSKFEKFYANPFSKFSSDYGFHFGKRSFDTDTAASNKVTVEKKKGDGKSRRKRQAIEEYDFIVVGAGSAGCVVASRLSEVKKWKVLLLEAGPEEPDVTSVPAFAPTLGRSSIDWMYRTQPEELTCRAQRGQTCAWLSGRVMGGSSAINYMVYMRGNRNDYDGWAELGNDGWSYDEVLPFFKKSEDNQNIKYIDKDYHGYNGPLNVERLDYVDNNVLMILNGFQEKGYPLVDFNGKQQIGTMVTQTTTKDGRRMSSNYAFIKPLRNKRSNLKVKTNAQVTKIIINSCKTANGVKYIINGTQYKARARKEIILSAGALNSPKILMLSGIGPKQQLEQLNIKVIKDLKVGYNLQDHASTDAVLFELTNKTSTLIEGKQLINEVLKFYKSGDNTGPLSSVGPLHIVAFHRTEYATDDETVPDIQYHFDGKNLEEFYSDPTTYLATNILPISYYNSMNVRPILLAPESRGYLTLNTTNPIFGQPLIYPRFFTKKRDLDKLISALTFATKLEDTEAFKENGAKFVRKPVKACSQYTWGTYGYFACVLTSYTSTIYHPSGTCKMGPYYDEDAVVDPRLRVHGVKRLRVADASIMPNIVRGNTNAPCIMIGEKASDMIKKDWIDNIGY